MPYAVSPLLLPEDVPVEKFNPKNAKTFPGRLSTLASALDRGKRMSADGWNPVYLDSVLSGAGLESARDAVNVTNLVWPSSRERLSLCQQVVEQFTKVLDEQRENLKQARDQASDFVDGTLVDRSLYASPLYAAGQSPHPYELTGLPSYEAQVEYQKMNQTERIASLNSRGIRTVDTFGAECVLMPWAEHYFAVDENNANVRLVVKALEAISDAETLAVAQLRQGEIFTSAEEQDIIKAKFRVGPSVLDAYGDKYDGVSAAERPELEFLADPYNPQYFLLSDAIAVGGRDYVWDKVKGYVPVPGPGVLLKVAKGLDLPSDVVSSVAIIDKLNKLRNLSEKFETIQKNAETVYYGATNAGKILYYKSADGTEIPWNGPPVWTGEGFSNAEAARRSGEDAGVTPQDWSPTEEDRELFTRWRVQDMSNNTDARIAQMLIYAAKAGYSTGDITVKLPETFEGSAKDLLDSPELAKAWNDGDFDRFHEILYGEQK